MWWVLFLIRSWLWELLPLSSDLGSERLDYGAGENLPAIFGKESVTYPFPHHTPRLFYYSPKTYIIRPRELQMRDPLPKMLSRSNTPRFSTVDAI